MHLLSHRLLHRLFDLDQPLLDVTCAGPADVVALDLLDGFVVVLDLDWGLKQEELLVGRDHAEHLVVVDALDAHLAILDADDGAVVDSTSAIWPRLKSPLVLAEHRVTLLRVSAALVLTGRASATTCLVLLQLDLVGRLNVEALGADEQGVHVHAEVLARIRQREELKELRVVEEEESAED